MEAGNKSCTSITGHKIHWQQVWLLQHRKITNVIKLTYIIDAELDKINTGISDDIHVENHTERPEQILQTSRMTWCHCALRPWFLSCIRVIMRSYIQWNSTRFYYSGKDNNSMKILNWCAIIFWNNGCPLDVMKKPSLWSKPFNDHADMTHRTMLH